MHFALLMNYPFQLRSHITSPCNRLSLTHAHTNTHTRTQYREETPIEEILNNGYEILQTTTTRSFAFVQVHRLTMRTRSLCIVVLS